MREWIRSTLSLAQCPFCGGHDCFMIYPDTRSWSCFQCGDKAGGSIIDFVAREKGCTEHEALTELATAMNSTNRLRAVSLHGRQPPQGR
nr:CHC2 zinc finger domain-containing protein [Desulfobacter latus]